MEKLYKHCSMRKQRHEQVLPELWNAEEKGSREWPTAARPPSTGAIASRMAPSLLPKSKPLPICRILHREAQGNGNARVHGPDPDPEHPETEAAEDQLNHRTSA